MSQRLLIAKITTAHGVKGLVKLHYYGENIADVEDYNPFYVSESGHDTIMIHVKNAIKNGYVAEIEGINDRTEAEAFRNTELYINEERLSPAQEGEFFQKDLIGCDAFEGDKKIGRIIAIDNFGAGDLLEIKPPMGQSFYLPFQDEFVGKIDIKNKKMEVSLPEGLID